MAGIPPDRVVVSARLEDTTVLNSGAVYVYHAGTGALLDTFKKPVPAEEDHFGESLMVTRKGAVSAREGELGIIPGSMGARSFIVRGKGNADSFESCSHPSGVEPTDPAVAFTIMYYGTASKIARCSSRVSSFLVRFVS